MSMSLGDHEVECVLSGDVKDASELVVGDLISPTGYSDHASRIESISYDEDAPKFSLESGEGVSLRASDKIALYKWT